MTSLRTWAMLTVVLGLSAGAAWGTTYGADKPANRRRLSIVREYQVPIVKGQKNVVTLPALLSFWGATNQQVIARSDFAYSVKPDQTETLGDVSGGDGRRFRLTWNSPDVDRISITQRLVVDLACQTVLETAAGLPYPQEVRKHFAGALGATKNINPDNPALEGVCRQLLAKAGSAEEAVELACDWVTESVKFKSGSPPASDTVLATRLGNCTGKANLTCAILRKMGIPAEPVSAKFIGGTGGHGFLEAYFPDAGWVFYDPTNSNRGFKSLDCLMTVGWAFSVAASKGKQWQRGFFCVEKDASPFREVAANGRIRLRVGPKDTNVVGARVLRRRPGGRVKVRHQSLRELCVDLAVPVGVRTYVSKPVVKRPETKPPATRPSRATLPERPPPASRPTPAGPDPREQQAAARLKLAGVYLTSGMKAKAGEIYRDVLRTFPGTKAAQTAKARLKELAGD